jgi:hypothetical protein
MASRPPQAQAQVTPKPRDGQPTAAERSQMVTWFTSRGYRGQELANVIAPGKSRQQIASDLIALQRQARKA